MPRSHRATRYSAPTGLDKAMSAEDKSADSSGGLVASLAMYTNMGPGLALWRSDIVALGRALLYATANWIQEGAMSRPCTEQAEESYLRRWVTAIGDTTIPLLAGFSVTSVIVMSDDATNFRWPGPAILVLGFASVVLIASVQ